MAFFTRRQPPQPDGRYEALEAEYRNYRRRTALELEDAAGKSARQTVLPFLSLYDDLNRALACPCGDAAFYQGVELIYKRLLQTLTDLGVKPMDSLGRMFNPTYHEAVEMISDPMLLVMISTVLVKLTVRPRPSVRRPSSRTCSSTLKISGCAFSISSKSTTE